MNSRNYIPAGRPVLGEEERDAVERVLRSGMIAQGPEVENFETEFANTVVAGTPCIALNSGTSALHLGLLAAGIGPGDEVIVPSFTFAATANSVVLTGATPVFADIDLETFNIDPVSVQNAITDNTRAIMPVHLYGLPANMPALIGLAEKFGLYIFEDAAQAHLATINGERVGSFGSFGAFSLYPTKNMTSAEGGMLSTPDAELARTVRLYRNQGMERRYENEIVGYNNRMTDLHAAIGRVQLSKVEYWTAQRQKNAAFLNDHLEGVVTPTTPVGFTHVFHQYTIRVEDATRLERDRICEVLEDQYAIGSGVYYPIPSHRLPSLESHAAGVDLPVTEKASQEVLSLPVHPSVQQHELERIVESVNSIMKAGA